MTVEVAAFVQIPFIRVIRGPKCNEALPQDRQTFQPRRSQTRLASSVGRSERPAPTAIMEGHYIRNHFFLEPGQLLRNAHRLRPVIESHLPAGGCRLRSFEYISNG